jgi:hypothetical protein
VTGSSLFVVADLVGIAAVAAWCHSRFPQARPRTLRGAVVHVAASFVAFNATPLLVRELAAVVPARLDIPVGMCLVVVPSLTYVFLSWIWLIARVRDLGSGTPRGGHRVPLASR